MTYTRKAGERRLLIVLNFGVQSRRFNLVDPKPRTTLLLSTYLDGEGQELGDGVLLRGNEGVILELL